jgi:hypothetical protein
MQVAGIWPLLFASSDPSRSYIQWHGASLVRKNNALQIWADQFVRLHSCRLAALHETLVSMQADFN